MRLVTWNEKNEPDLPVWQVTHDCRAMGHLIGSGGTIVGGQEFEDRSDRVALQAAFPGWLVEGAYPVPLLVNPRHFKVLGSGYVMTHGGLAGVSPHRGFSWVKVQRKRRPGVKPFIVVNTHYVSGAWSPGHTAQEWRRDRWREHHAKITAFITEQNNKGLDVFLIGDMNRVEYDPHTISRAAIHLAHHGLDHIIYAPADGRKIRDVSSYAVQRALYTDHRPLVAAFTLTRRRVR